MATYIPFSDNKTFEPAPEGLWPLICCDVVEKGIVETQWGPKQKVQLRWQLGEEAGVREDGKPWLVMRTFTRSLFKMAELSKTLVRWRGRPFTEEELRGQEGKGYDLDNVIRAVGLGNIIQVTLDDGRVFANVDTIMPLPKAMKKPVIRDYIQERDREPASPATTQTHETMSDEDWVESLGRDQEENLPVHSDTILPKLVEVVRQLGYANAVEKINEAVEKKHPGMPWAVLTVEQKTVIYDAVKRTLDKKLKADLDAQAVREEVPGPEVDRGEWRIQ